MQQNNKTLERKFSISAASRGSGKNSLYSKLGSMFADQIEIQKKKFLIDKLEKKFCI